MHSSRGDRLCPEQFRASTREQLLGAVAEALDEPPDPSALAARSTAVAALLDQSEEQLSAEVLSDLLQGMTWNEPAGPITALVKLSEQDAAWTYAFSFVNPRSGAVETVSSGGSFSSKREARLRAAAAVWETAAKLTGALSAGSNVI